MKAMTRYLSSKPETDTTPSGRERVTPARSIWELDPIQDGGELFNLICPATSAAIRVTYEELQTDFTYMPEPVDLYGLVTELRFAQRHRGSRHVSALADALEAWGKHPAAYRSAAEFIRAVGAAKDALDIAEVN